MTYGQFVWCDLSTFDIAKATDFYSALFGWRPLPARNKFANDDYTWFHTADAPAAGLFTMPEFFQRIKMPSFWMSYVHVSDLDRTYERAVALGAKGEIEPSPFDVGSRFGLIRDPSGAGFSLYEGPSLAGRDPQRHPGRMVCNELHVPSVAEVKSFYEALFEWRFAKDSSTEGRHWLQLPTGEQVGSVLELSETMRGQKNYWAVFLAVTDLSMTLAKVSAMGGSVHGERWGPRDQYAMASDSQGAVFCLVDASLDAV